MSRIINITLIEPSEIISQGIISILSNSGLNHKAITADNLHNFEETIIRNSPDIVLVNPAFVQNQVKEFQVIRRRSPEIHWIGIVYTLTDHQILSLFDDVIYINDTPGKIFSSIQKLLSGTQQVKPSQETLSEREIDVLKLLVAGNANKEIADKLNISTHTVITHRKNISQKTGIKSVSGLTIYAVLKEIISVSDYME